MGLKEFFGKKAVRYENDIGQESAAGKDTQRIFDERLQQKRLNTSIGSPEDGRLDRMSGANMDPFRRSAAAKILQSLLGGAPAQDSSGLDDMERREAGGQTDSTVEREKQKLRRGF